MFNGKSYLSYYKIHSNEKVLIYSIGIKGENIMGYYDEGFNEWSEAMASIVDEEDETSRDIAYYLASGIMGALYSVANELHELNEQFKRPLVVDNIGK